MSRLTGASRASAILSLVAVLLGAIGCGASKTSSEARTPVSPPFAIDTEATMNGHSAKAGIAVPVLNVWNTVPPSEATCTLQQGERVMVRESKYYAAESRWYLRIEHGTCAGWVPETSLSK